MRRADLAPCQTIAARNANVPKTISDVPYRASYNPSSSPRDRSQARPNGATSEATNNRRARCAEDEEPTNTSSGPPWGKVAIVPNARMIMVTALLCAIRVDPASTDGVSAAMTKSKTLSEATAMATTKAHDTIRRTMGDALKRRPKPIAGEQRTVIGDSRLGWTVPT